jgi:hypothetical protein
VNFDRVEPKHQVLAKSSGSDISFQSAFVAESTRTLTLRVLEEPTRSNSPVSSTRKSFGWSVIGTFANLVEKKCAAVGQFKSADAIGLRVRKCTTHMTKQFALEQTFRESGRVNRHQRLRGAIRNRVERTRDDFLSRSVLTGDEHVRVCGTDALDDVHD